jgi:hypothetical protein
VDWLEWPGVEGDERHEEKIKALHKSHLLVFSLQAMWNSEMWERGRATELDASESSLNILCRMN